METSLASGRVHWRALRLLIADDDQDTVATLSAILEDEGHEVCAVRHALEVVPAVQRFQPEAVILDIAMPKMNGYDIAKEIVRQFKTSRPFLIAISGLLDGRDDALFSKRVGFDHHLANCSCWRR